jgi:hypothetical protein
MNTNSERPTTRALSILISCTAAALALVHITWPSLSIDSITLTLIVLASLPWLAPLFKSIEAPGGWKVEFQELKREVEAKSQEVTALSNRVRQVERMVFSGQTTPDFVRAATNAVIGLHDYFNGVGAEIGSSHPTIHVEGATPVGHYEPETNRIVIGVESRENIDLLLRLYALHILTELSARSQRDPNQVVQSALATYFPCSFSNRPTLGFTREQAEEEEKRTGIPYYHNLAHHRKVTDLPKPLRGSRFGGVDVDSIWNAAHVWGGAFWALREELGAPATDRALLLAWTSTTVNMRDGFGKEYTRDIMRAFDRGQEDKVSRVLRDRDFEV